MNKIYLEKFKNKKPRSLKELLNEFFIKTVTGIYKSEITYSDPECTKIECGKYKNRSFDAIVKLVNTYFKSFSENEILNMLLTLKLDENRYPIFLYCGDVSNYVMCYSMSKVSLNLIKDFCDTSSRYGFKSEKISWVERLSRIGIKSNEDFDKKLQK